MKYLALLFPLLLTACATTSTNEPRVMRIPSHGAVSTIGVGDTLYEWRYATIDQMLRGQGWKKELVYLGMKDDQIRVVFRDYTGNLRKPSIEQESQHDFERGSAFSYNGAEIMVLNVDGGQLTYQVGSGFRTEIGE